MAQSKPHDSNADQKKGGAEIVGPAAPRRGF